MVDIPGNVNYLCQQTRGAFESGKHRQSRLPHIVPGNSPRGPETVLSEDRKTKKSPERIRGMKCRIAICDQ